MPIIRYICFAGAFVVALLFALDRQLPPPAAASAGMDVDRSIIRIQSARTLPEKIIFDTSSGFAAAIAAPAVAAELPHAVASDAFAMAAPQKQDIARSPPNKATRSANHQARRKERRAASRGPSERQAMVGAF